MRGLLEGLHPAAYWGILLVALGILAYVVRALLRFAWRSYSEKREELYQPAILMAIANEAFRTLGPPFADSRRLGDWTIVEEAVLKWSKGLRGFARTAFTQICEQNGFAEYERGRLKSGRASVRTRASQRLGQMLYMKAVPDLLKALGDHTPEVRRMASWALANMGQSDQAVRVVTTAKPQLLKDSLRRRGGSVSGRFYWEEGDHITITHDQETAYLMRQRGGMTGNVRNMPRLTRDGRTIDDAVWESYYSEYRLNWIDSRYPASIRAMLKQSIEDYYIVSYRDRDNVLLSEGCLTENIDFVFPRYVNPDDRLSVKGRLLIPEGGSMRNRAKVPEAWVSLRGERSDFCTEYRSFDAVGTFRFHDVPPGMYRVRATYAEFGSESSVEVSQTQPMVLDLLLK